MINETNALFGHTSPETAHITEDYPYGFTARTTRREWVETAVKGAQKGKMRFVTQTQNPKNGKWNAPKAGIYVDIVVMYTDWQGHTAWAYIDVNSKPAVFTQFKAFADKLTPAQQQRLAGMEKMARTPGWNADAWYDYDVEQGVIDPTVTPRPSNPWKIVRKEPRQLV